MAGRSSLRHRAWLSACSLVFLASTLVVQLLPAQSFFLSPPPHTQTISGIVLDPSGAAVSSSSILFVCGNTRRNTTSAANGEFSLALPEGKCRVAIHAAGFSTYEQEIEVPYDRPQDPLTFRLLLGAEQSTVTVTANQDYVGDETQTGTKTSTPLIETPQTISVITLDQLQQQNVQTVMDALRYTPGVNAETYGSDTRYDWVRIRGFDAGTYGMFRDGMRWQSGQIAGRTEPYGLEELDVLKGPASVLYGQSQPGGLVNMVSKRPLSTPFHQIEWNSGSYNRRQFKADLSGPLDSRGHLLYRITTLIRNSDNQVDYVPDNRRYVAPSLTWIPDNKGSLTLLGEYQHDHAGFGQFLPAYGTLLPNPYGVVPIYRYMGEPTFDYFLRDQYHFGWTFERHLDKRWSIRQTTRYSNISWEGNDIYGYALEHDYRTLDRIAFSGHFDSHLYTTDTQAHASWNSSNISQTLLAGVDYSNGVMDQPTFWTIGPSIDIFKPVYGVKMPLLPPASSSHQPSHQTGVYLQDQLKIRQHLIFTFGGREDWAYIDTQDLLAKSSAKQNPSRFTERAGVTYLTNFGLAPYFSYSTSFLPTTGTDLFGKAFKPTTGRQYEAGLKYQPHGWRGFFTASFYNITQQNVQTPDGLNTIQTGEIRSRGMELEAVTKLLSTLTLHTGYMYDDVKVTRTTVDSELGKRPILAPEQSASLIADYTVPRGRLKGLGLGAGTRYTGISAGSSTNEFIVPGYTLFDTNLRYDFGAFRLSVNATNIADKRYVSVCTGLSYCNYGSTRNVIGGIRWNLPGGERTKK